MSGDSRCSPAGTVLASTEADVACSPLPFVRADDVGPDLFEQGGHLAEARDAGSLHPRMQCGDTDVQLPGCGRNVPVMFFFDVAPES